MGAAAHAVGTEFQYRDAAPFRRAFPQRRHGGRNRGRMMGEIIEHADASDRAEEFKPSLHASE